MCGGYAVFIQENVSTLPLVPEGTLVPELEQLEPGTWTLQRTTATDVWT